MKPDTSTEASSKPESTGTATQTSSSNPPGAATNDGSRMAPFWSQYRLQIRGKPEEIQFIPSDKLNVAETVKDISRIRNMSPSEFELTLLSTYKADPKNGGWNASYIGDQKEQRFTKLCVEECTSRGEYCTGERVPTELAPSIVRELAFNLHIDLSEEDLVGEDLASITYQLASQATAGSASSNPSSSKDE